MKRSNARYSRSPWEWRTEMPSRRHLLLWGVLGVCLVMLGAACFGVFRVREVDVIGSNVPVQTVIQAAGVEGQNIFTVQSDRVIARLGGLREIVVQRVDTSFPDRITIYTDVRQPVVALQVSTTLTELDADGMPIHEVPSTRLPVIQEAAPGERVGPGVVQAVLDAVHRLATVPDGSIASLRFTRSSGLTIAGRGGWTAIVGTGTRQTMRDRVYTLASLLALNDNLPHHIQLVDLRGSTRFVRYAPS